MFIPQLHCSLELSPCAVQATLGDSYFESHGCHWESCLHMADVTWLCISPRITECPCLAKCAFAFSFAHLKPVSGLQPGTWWEPHWLSLWVPVPLDMRLCQEGMQSLAQSELGAFSARNNYVTSHRHWNALEAARSQVVKLAAFSQMRRRKGTFI